MPENTTTPATLITEENIISKDNFTKLSFKDQIAVIAKICHNYITEHLPAYDPDIVYAERLSLWDGDWYLWHIVVKNLKDQTYTLWTLNLTSGSFAHGHYSIGSEHLDDELKNIR